MSVSCSICKSISHNVFNCDSNRAKTVDEAVNHWLSNRLIQIYITGENKKEIYWICKSPHFSRLTIGDLLYLNRDVLNGETRLSKERLIYLFIYTSMRNMCIDAFSKKTRGYILIDIKYWFLLFQRKSTPELLEENRQTQIKNSEYSIRSLSNVLKKEIDCPICLNDGITKYCVYNCNHIICIDCSDELINRDSICPLCRSEIKGITNYL